MVHITLWTSPNSYALYSPICDLQNKWVSLRLWRLAGGNGTCSARSDDLCHSEASGDPYQLDLLIMQQVFGSDRQQKYAYFAGNIYPQ